MSKKIERLKALVAKAENELRIAEMEMGHQKGGPAYELYCATGHYWLTIAKEVGLFSDGDNPRKAALEASELARKYAESMRLPWPTRRQITEVRSERLGKEAYGAVINQPKNVDIICRERGISRKRVMVHARMYAKAHGLRWPIVPLECPQELEGRVYPKSHCPPEIETLLGTMNDSHLAEETGETVRHIRQWRIARKIPLCRKNRPGAGRKKKASWEALVRCLGTATDTELGRRFGYSKERVRQIRNQFGIPKYIIRKKEKKK